MCQTIHYRSRCCRHHWLQIWMPCGPGQGFYTCGSFNDGCARDPSPECDVDGLCPACAFSSSPASRNNNNSRSGSGSGSGHNSCTALGFPAAGPPADAVHYDYDRHYVRMVTDIRDRVRWGEGPCRQDPGIECAVM